MRGPALPFRQGSDREGGGGGLKEEEKKTERSLQQKEKIPNGNK